MDFKLNFKLNLKFHDETDEEMSCTNQILIQFEFYNMHFKPDLNLTHKGR